MGESTPLNSSHHQSSVAFSVDTKDQDGPSRGLDRRSSQRASMFSRARRSFVRSKGERGASLQHLRGTSGADFEDSGVQVERLGPGSAGGGCGCFGSPSDRNVIVLIKGSFVFVFASVHASSPKYAVRLAQLKCKVLDNDLSTCQLQTSLGDVEYEFTFGNHETAAKFALVANREATAGEAAEVRTKLGHAHLLQKRASVKFAQSIAKTKTKEAPENGGDRGGGLSSAAEEAAAFQMGPM